MFTCKRFLKKTLPKKDQRNREKRVDMLSYFYHHLKINNKKNNKKKKQRIL